jgi:hypothetical protein
MSRDFVSAIGTAQASNVLPFQLALSKCVPAARGSHAYYRFAQMHELGHSFRGGAGRQKV